MISAMHDQREAPRSFIASGRPSSAPRQRLLRSLRERLVVLLDELPVFLRHVVGAGQEHFAALHLGLTTEVELEALHAFGDGCLEPFERRGVLIDAIVVQRAQVAEHVVERARIDALALQHPAKLLCVVGELPRFAAPLANVARIELAAEPASAAIAVAAAVGEASAERVAVAVGAVLRAVAGVATSALLPLLTALTLLTLLPCWPLWPCWPC